MTLLSAAANVSTNSLVLGEWHTNSKGSYESDEMRHDRVVVSTSREGWCVGIVREGYQPLCTRRTHGARGEA